MLNEINVIDIPNLSQIRYYYQEVSQAHTQRAQQVRQEGKSAEGFLRNAEWFQEIACSLDVMDEQGQQIYIEDCALHVIRLLTKSYISQKETESR